MPINIEKIIRQSCALLVLAGVAGGLGLLLWHIPFIATFERSTVDWRMRSRGADPAYGKNIVVILIDDAALQEFPCRSPVPRDMLAKLIRFLAASKNKLIGLDVFLKDPGWEDRDAELVDAIKEHGGVVIASTLQSDAFSVDLPHPRFLEAALATALVHIPVDPVDGVIREYQTFFNARGKQVPTLSTSLYLLDHGYGVGQHKFCIANEGGRTWPPELRLDISGQFYINYQAPPSGCQAPAAKTKSDPNGSYVNPIKVFPASAVLTGFLPHEWFKDAVVLIGAGFTDSKDEYPSPYSSPAFDYVLTPGVEIHANALATLQLGKSINFASQTTHFFLLSIAALIVIFSALRFRTLVSLFIPLASATGFAFFCFYSFMAHNLMFGIVPFWIGLAIAYIEGAGYKAATEGRQKRWIKHAFERYVSSDVVNQLVRDPGKLHLGGEPREVSILFTDLADFTNISEHLNPQELVGLLNSYFDGATRIILKHGGTLDKYIGDSIMAFWNAPLFQENHVRRAAQAALDIQTFCEQFNTTLPPQGYAPVKTRIGLNTGRAVVGNIGARNRFNYTIIGDEVNLASRLEGSNKIYGTSVMISESVYERIRQGFCARELDLLRVMGKKKPVRVFELLRSSDGQCDESFEQMLFHYRQGLDAYRRQEWQRAETCFQTALKYAASDQPCRVYLDRCKYMQKNPPGENWDGVYIMQTK